MKIVKVVLLVILVMIAVAIALPAFLAYRCDSRDNLCQNQLRLIHYAKEVLAIRNNWTNGYVIAATPEEIWVVLGPWVEGEHRLYCPELGSTHYNYNPIGVPPTCPYGKTHIYIPLDEQDAPHRRP
jgi:hypothetical protein